MARSEPAPMVLDSTSGQATHARYKVVALAILLGMVTYLDRVCISKLAPDIMRDLGLSKTQMGYVFSAFALAYAVFEIPTAWWADRRGTRKVLTRIVLWWSAFTIATAGAFNYLSLLLTRFLFGIGEAGAWPSVARSFSKWIPRKERGTIQGIFFTGAHLAGGITPILVVALLSFISWRWIFVVFGCVGFVWAAVWYWWFRDDPADHPAVNAAELQQITSDRAPDAPHSASWDYWKQLLTSPTMLALCLMYFPNSMVFYFCITWLPTFLKEQHKSSSAIMIGLPLLLSVLGDLFGGVVTDRVTARLGIRAGRCGVGGVAYLVAGICLICAGFSTSALSAAVLISIATAAAMFTLAASWGTCIDVGGDHAGVVSATMNTSGQIGSMIVPVFVAYCAESLGNWSIPLYVIGGFFLVGVICWAIIDPRRPIFPGVASSGSTRTCVGCGAVVPATAAYCKQCGKHLQP